MASERPTNKNGPKDLDCPHYESCLTYAAQEDWSFFSCEDCDCFELKDSPGEKILDAQKKNEKGFCKKCNKRPTIQPNSPYCSICLNEMRKRARDGKKNISVVAKKKKKGNNKAKTERTQRGAKAVLTIDFEKHAAILTTISKLAEEEFRPLNLQIIFMLKNQLEAIKGTKNT